MSGATSLMVHYPPYYGVERTLDMLRLFAAELLPELHRMEDGAPVPLQRGRVTGPSRCPGERLTEERLAEAAALIGKPLAPLAPAMDRDRNPRRHSPFRLGRRRRQSALARRRPCRKRSPAGGIVAPPCILYAVDMTIVAPKLSGVQWIYAGTEFTWFDRIRLDTRFEVEARLVRQEVKSGRRFAALGVADRGDRLSGRRRQAPSQSAVGQVARTPRGVRLETESGGEAGGTAAYRYAPRGAGRRSNARCWPKPAGGARRRSTGRMSRSATAVAAGGEGAAHHHRYRGVVFGHAGRHALWRGAWGRGALPPAP